jgi:hypothetical protein
MNNLLAVLDKFEVIGNLKFFTEIYSEFRVMGPGLLHCIFYLPLHLLPKVVAATTQVLILVTAPNSNGKAKIQQTKLSFEPRPHESPVRCSTQVYGIWRSNSAYRYRLLYLKKNLWCIFIIL